MKREIWGLVGATALAVTGCDLGARAPAGPALSIAVAPLSLEGVSDAVYTLRVVNGGGEEVWSRSVSSTQYGDGAGAISYVGTCDAESNPNTVELVLDELDANGSPLVDGVDFINPAPAGAPVVQTVDCVADQDTAVTFNVTFARAAQQGFFDVAMTLTDLFCSAKLDCEDEAGQPLRLLHDSTGQRAPTAVMAFACTGGAGSETHLYLSDIDVTCGGTTTSLDPGAGPGNLSAVAGSGVPDAHIFEALVTQGAEQLGTYDKRYWNIALGLADVVGCTLSATGTASDGLLAAGQTPVDTTWPYVRWDGSLETCGRHALNGADGVVSVAYTDLAGTGFPHAYPENPIGLAPSTPATTCAQLHEVEPLRPTGDYWVDPDGAGPGAPFEARCDMTTDGGGWMRCAWIDYVADTSTVTYDAGGNVIASSVGASYLGAGGTAAVKHACFDYLDETGFGLTHALDGSAGGPYDFSYFGDVSAPVSGSDTFAFITAGQNSYCDGATSVGITWSSYPDQPPGWFLFGADAGSHLCYTDGTYSGASSGLWLRVVRTAVDNTWLELSNGTFDRLGVANSTASTKRDGVVELWVR